VGYRNKGTILITGDAGGSVGYANTGTITVNGTIKSLDKKASGTIIAKEVKEDNGRHWIKI